MEDVCYVDHARLKYFKLDDNEKWKVSMIQEIIDLKQGELEVPGFDLEELDAMLHYLCTD